MSQLRSTERRTDQVSCVLIALLSTSFLLSGCTDPLPPPTAKTETVTISVIGTNDVHGQILPVDGNRGLALFGGYLNNLRELRSATGGDVVVIDAGDMWQGTLESNLTEGASVVEAFNELGYVAATVGNHEFDFGPVGEKPIPESDQDDPQGALKARATEARFAMLAANIMNSATGKSVDWPNVQPSLMVDVAGIQIGIIGVLAEFGLKNVIAANAPGLYMAPLAETITREAQALRDQGAEIVIVTAHAGSRCDSFDDPGDLSSCRMDGEIMRVAQAIPAGLVDQIIAGHTHRGIAHEVGGIAITESFSRTNAFGRVDYTFDLKDRLVTERKIFPPQAICAHQIESSPICAAENDTGASAAVYAGKTVEPDSTVAMIASKAEAYANDIKSEKLGVVLETPFNLTGSPGSPLGHLFMDAIMESTDGDIVIQNVGGGLRANLPQGELTYGSVYEVFPFDNRVVTLDFSGEELRNIIAKQAAVNRPVEFSGMRVEINCTDGGFDVTMQRPDGTEIEDTEQLKIVTTDYLATGGVEVFEPVELGRSAFPLMREIFADWLRARGGTLNAEEFLETGNPRWSFPEGGVSSCAQPTIIETQ